MINTQAVRIPSAHEDDYEDVHLALSAASTLWRAGDDDEALKWLRRAAGAAAERDADRRAVELAKAAADVAEIIDERNSSLPPGQPPVIPRPSSAPVRPTPPPLPAPTSGASRRHAAPGQRNALVPAELEHLRHADFRVNEGDEDTFVRPETMLRRALLAIDPAYAQRTDYDQANAGPARAPLDFPASLTPSREAVDTETDAEAPTPVRNVGASVMDAGEEAPEHDTERQLRAAPTDQHLRVAVVPIPEEGDVRLLFLPPGAQAPPGVATALLVAPTAHDAALLAKLYKESDAKL